MVIGPDVVVVVLTVLGFVEETSGMSGISPVASPPWATVLISPAMATWPVGPRSMLETLIVPTLPLMLTWALRTDRADRERVDRAVQGRHPALELGGSRRQTAELHPIGFAGC